MNELKWKLYSNSLDFVSRHKLTRQQLKNNDGMFAVWRGSLPNGPQSILTQVSYSLGTEITETVYILAVLDLKDLLSLMEFSPDAILNLPDKKITSLKTKGALCESKLARIEHRIQNEHRKNRGEMEKWSNQEYYEQPLYDREILNPGEYLNGNISFFRTALGGKSYSSSGWEPEYKPLIIQSRMKAQRDTNMNIGGSLPYPKQFTFNGYSLIPDLDANPEDFKRLIDACWFRFFIGTMDRHYFPARLVASIPDISPGQPMKLSTSLGPHFELSEPDCLISQQNFRAEICLSNTKIPLKIEQPLGITCILWGHFIREVR